MNHLESIDKVSAIIKSMLHSHDLDPLAREHLERAHIHVSESWIAQDGQQARSLEQLIKDDNFGRAILEKAKKATPGDEIRIGERTFVVRSSEQFLGHEKTQPQIKP